MKILLLGEYSRLHNSLKEGLIALNHEVIIIGSGDSFKSYPVDYKITSVFKDNTLLHFLSKALLRLTGINITEIELAIKYFLTIKKLDQFDVVQLINESSIKTSSNLEISVLKKLFKKTKKQFLLSCGEDYHSINHAIKQKEKYSILTPFLNDQTNKKRYTSTLKNVSDKHYKLHLFLSKACHGIIASDMDYHLPLIKKQNYLGLIPNPINSDLIPFKQLKVKDKIHVFLGINTQNAIKKGIVFFEKALDIIAEKHPDKIIITKTTNLPYNEYIESFNQAHIVLDQVYSYDQGYNALEAMAKGKVVFTGAEQEWLDYYNVKEDTIVINALPDINYLVKKLEWLIYQPKQIETISTNANSFIKQHHNYKAIAKTYIKTWEEA